jgi:hypothetical protein
MWNKETKMKKFTVFAFLLVIFLSNNTIFAQEDDIPYLSDDDIASIEVVLPDDIPVNPNETTSTVVVEVQKEVDPNEISRLNTSLSLYHLLILDRTYCSLYSDISGVSNITILYKLKHGKNGYLIAIYKSSREGPVFPILPDRSRILVNLSTTRKATLKEYVNSSAFKKFVTSRTILTQIQTVLNRNN